MKHKVNHIFQPSFFVGRRIHYEHQRELSKPNISLFYLHFCIVFLCSFIINCHLPLVFFSWFVTNGKTHFPHVNLRKILNLTTRWWKMSIDSGLESQQLLYERLVLNVHAGESTFWGEEQRAFLQKYLIKMSFAINSAVYIEYDNHFVIFPLIQQYQGHKHKLIYISSHSFGQTFCN